MGPATRATKVLVVEDEPLINQAVGDRLRAEGHEVVSAYDGPGAVAAHEEHQPDLVVLDVMLPGFDGLEVCRRIQQVRPVPVLMLTARDLVHVLDASCSRWHGGTVVRAVHGSPR